MMILPLADALQNCFQNLTSRIAGMDNDQMSNRVIGASAMLGFGIGAIREQFRNPAQKGNDGNGSPTVGLKGFFSRAKAVISPSTNLSDERDYNGNVNPIRDVVPNKTVNNNVLAPNSNIINQNTMPNNVVNQNNNNLDNKNISAKTVIGKAVGTTAKASKAFLGVGYSMVEGDFSQYKRKPSDKKNIQRNDYKNIEYMNKLNENRTNEKLGDDNESNR